MTTNLLGGLTPINSGLGSEQLVGMPASKMPQDLASGFVIAQEDFVGASYKPIYIVSLKLTNGINYSLVCEATLSTQAADKKITITEINIPAGSIGGKGAKIAKVTDASDPDVPDDILTLFNTAKSKVIGASHAPIKLIASQIVSGIAYYIICESKVVRPGSNPYATLAKLWLKPNGEVEISFDKLPKR